MLLLNKIACKHISGHRVYVSFRLCVAVTPANREMTLNGYLLGSLCGAGITGNLLTLVVLQRDNDKKNPTNWLLQAHAVFDSIYLLMRLLARQFQYLGCRQLDWLPAAVNQHSDTVALYMASGASLAHMVGIWTMVVITVDRYIAVCLPSEVQLRTVRRVKMAVALSGRRVNVAALCQSDHNASKWLLH